MSDRAPSPSSAPTTTLSYRKKPVVIEAIQYLGGGNVEGHASPGWLWEALEAGVAYYANGGEPLRLKTLEGDHVVSPGDFIIRGVKGELYPCKPDIFALTYEPATASPPSPAPTPTTLTMDEVNVYAAAYHRHINAELADAPNLLELRDAYWQAYSVLESRLRSSASALAPDRPFPIQGKTTHRTIPWWLAEEAYAVYSSDYGTSQSLARLAERGGFSAGELDMFIPGWRDRLDRVKRLESALAEAERRGEQASDNFDMMVQKWGSERAESTRYWAALNKIADEASSNPAYYGEEFSTTIKRLQEIVRAALAPGHPEVDR